MSKVAIVEFGEAASIGNDTAAQAPVAQSGPAASDPAVEATRRSWFEACGQAAVAEKMQPAMLHGASYLQLDQFPQPTFYGRSLDAISAKFWPVRTS